MGILSSAGKDAGVEAAREIHATVDSALNTVDTKTIPEAEAAAKAIVLTAVNGAYGLLVDLMNRVNGAEVPIDITIHIQGKLGPVKMNAPAEMTAQSVEVQG